MLVSGGAGVGPRGVVSDRFERTTQQASPSLRGTGRRRHAPTKAARQITCKGFGSSLSAAAGPGTALDRALALQLDVVRRVHFESLGLMSRCEGWTVREVLNHSVGVTTKFTDFASGSTDEPHTPPGDLIGQDHTAAVAGAIRRARDVWSRADMSRTCRLVISVDLDENGELSGIGPDSE